MKHYTIGVDLGGTNIAAGLVDENDKVIASLSCKTNLPRPEAEVEKSIAELCQKFSMSRSSLQILFKENMDISPKKYINEMKLEKSRQMICENKYTISEIALMLGFNSIHYFSRAFTQKYHMAPSEYSKTLYKA